jgi:Bacterial regulatory proteins, luxR family
MISPLSHVDAPAIATSQYFPMADQTLATPRISAAIEGTFSVETLILGLIRLGILVVSQDLQMIYANVQAKTLCQTILGRSEPALPPAVQSACQQFLAGASDFQPWVSNYRANSASFDTHALNQLLIRIKVRWLYTPALTAEAQPPIPLLVTLEDYHESMRLEMQQEKRQYGLTDRETEIGMLLRLGWSYQAIADHVHISVNTVKSHVRHLYNKRRKSFKLGNFAAEDRACG